MDLWSFSSHWINYLVQNLSFEYPSFPWCFLFLNPDGFEHVPHTLALVFPNLPDICNMYVKLSKKEVSISSWLILITIGLSCTLTYVEHSNSEIIYNKNNIKGKFKMCKMVQFVRKCKEFFPEQSWWKFSKYFFAQNNFFSLSYKHLADQVIKR